MGPLGDDFVFTSGLLLGSTVNVPFILLSYCPQLLPLVYLKYSCSMCDFRGIPLIGIHSVSTLGLLWVYSESTQENSQPRVNSKSKPRLSWGSLSVRFGLIGTVYYVMHHISHLFPCSFMREDQWNKKERLISKT